MCEAGQTHSASAEAARSGEWIISIRQISDPIAYLTGEYPKVSHTFIQREIEALRRSGVPIHTFSVRRPSTKDILADQANELRNTFYVLENCRNTGRFLGAHLTNVAKHPGAFFRTLGLAWSMRQPGWRSSLYQLFYFAEAVVLADELRRRGVGHLHNHFGDSSCSVAVLASALSGIPFSFTEHGPAIFFEAKRWHLDTKIARAKFVVAISHFCRSQLMLFSRPEHWSKISIVHCGVHPSRYKSSVTTSPGKKILYVGRLEPVKGLLVLLESVASLIGRHPDMHLTVVGDGTARGAIEAEAERLALNEAVDFVGYKTQDEVADLLTQADMLVLPSFAEGVPVVLMEAMASSKPVIASRVAGVQELVHDGVNGFTVPAGDAVALANRINELFENPALGDSMGRSGRHMVEQEFDVEREAGLLAKLFVAGHMESHHARVEGQLATQAARSARLLPFRTPL
jgi:glycosyltransferase involved in cell wall biosynthesis